MVVEWFDPTPKSKIKNEKTMAKQAQAPTLEDFIASNASSRLIMVRYDDLKRWAESLLEIRDKTLRENIDEVYLSAEQLSEQFSLSSTTIYEYEKRGVIRAYRFAKGGKKVYKKSEIIALLEAPKID